MICFSRRKLEEYAQYRPEGYVAEVLGIARSEGDRLCLEPALYQQLRAKYRPQMAQPPREKPGIALRAKARRLAAALMRWLRAGCPVTERQARAARKACCEACTYWRASGNAGMGECRHPACGCTRAKRWLATETCPEGMWPETALKPLFRGLAEALKAALWAALKRRLKR